MPPTPAIRRRWCPACGFDLRRLSDGERFAHYLVHIRTDPIPARFLRDRRFKGDER